MARTMPSVHSLRLRSSSVSSMRSTNVPECWRANSQLNSAERALPTWKYPVGEGAKRTRGAAAGVGSVIRWVGAVTRRSGQPQCGGASVILGNGDGARGAAVHRLAQLLAQLLRRVLVEDVEIAVITHLEDLGQYAHADGVAGTLVEVH